MIPYTISSDAHGDFNSFHDFDKLDYSLYGAMTRLWNLGVSLEDVILSTTLNPAKILKEENEIGSLTIGSRADLSLIEIDYTPRTMIDGLGVELLVNRSLLPWITIRAGEVLVPHRKFIRDLLPLEQKKEDENK
jgi:dihydroorotase